MVEKLLRGALAGVLATIPMTIFMRRAFRALPREERYPLPPREITEELADKADAPLEENEARALTYVAHFGYGGAMGALYRAIAPRLPISPRVKGPLFGLAVWAGSYLFALPALGILRPATEHPRRRNALMIAAHLVWGGALAASSGQKGGR